MPNGAVSSLTHCSNPFQVNMFISRIKIQILHNITTKCTGREKTSEKRDVKYLSFKICVVTNFSAPSCICLCTFCFWGEVSNSEILNDIGSKRLDGK
jgi:hypothetical protein